MVACALFLWPKAALAHTANLSQGTLTRNGEREITIELAFAKTDYERIRGGNLVTVTDGSGTACPEDVSAPAGVDDGIIVRIHATCTDTVQSARFDLWPKLDARHRLLLHLDDRDIIVERTGSEVELRTGNKVPTKSALRLGFEHVALGYDHLLFLFGLALASTVAGEKRSRLFLAVTAFTLTHTAALAIAFRGAVTIPERPVEVLIACTIGFVGLEVLRKAKHGASPLACAAFGCVHGLGFGTAFRGALAATSASTLGLATVGVEAAQLLAASVALGVLQLPGVARTNVRRGLAFGLFVIGLGLAAWRALS